MADRTRIEWAQATWNPLVGCTKVSAGCDNCYALGEVNRRHAAALSPKTSPRMLEAFPARFDTVSIRPERFLTQPLRWAQPRRIFVNSLSDLFHTDVPDEFIARVFAVMALAPQHTFQLLTKRHARMRSLLSSPRFADLFDQAVCDSPDWDVRLREAAVESAQNLMRRGEALRPLPNAWIGVSVEDQHWADIRIPALLGTPAAVRWISAEPLLGPVDLTGRGGTGVYALPDPAEYDGGEPVCQQHGMERCTQGCAFLDWVVAGGESGQGARPMHPQWARDLRDQCTAADVPFLFKQWGSHRPVTRAEVIERSDRLVYFADQPGPDSAWLRHVPRKSAGRELDGRTHDGYPQAVRT
ncbi:MAG: phage Gp37/Gp68 family protein [Frankiales bacterium]|nr:phage Gp37/Gp68 family protein [Frankiales bacterium]